MVRLRPAGPADRLLLTLRTVRHLRAGQIVHRLLRAFARAPRRVAGGYRVVAANKPWQPPERLPLALGDEGLWTFFGLSLPVRQPTQWDDPQRPRLWRYHLHYFDDLRGREAAARAAELDPWIDRWIAENLPGRGTGWEPYPLSRRIVSWIVWSLSGHPLSARRVDSLALQAAHLRARLERDLGANHLLANAKALVFAGVALEGPSAPEWLRTGLEILDREIPEQLLADGGHVERSPMYHATCLEDVLDLVRLADLFPEEPHLAHRASGWCAAAAAMSEFLVRLTHPDGEIAFFNDAAFGIAPPPGHLLANAAALGVARPVPPTDAWLGASGYGRCAAGELLVLFDAAAVGPDHQPGHAHADTLSFELSVGDERLVVNSGTSTYQLGERRQFERSTAAHSTVEIGGEDSSEVWSAFRVARRARVRDVFLRRTGEALEIGAAHDGYARLRGRPIHRRLLRLAEGALEVTDEVLGAGNHPVVARFGLHPAVRAARADAGRWILTLPSGRELTLESLDGLDLEEEAGTYAPRFGEVRERRVILWRWAGALPLRARIALRVR